MKLLCCLILSLTVVRADVLKDGPCPDIKATTNFDLKSYQGTWYEIKKLPIANAADGECATVEYTYDAYNDLLKYKGGHITEEGLRKTVYGIITRNPEISDGDLTLSTVVGDYVRVGPLKILATDYRNYAIAYSCKYLETSEEHRVNLWILSRNKTLSEGSKKIVNYFFKDNADEFDESRFIETDQSKAACSFKKSYVYTVPFGQ